MSHDQLALRRRKLRLQEARSLAEVTQQESGHTRRHPQAGWLRGCPSCLSSGLPALFFISGHRFAWICSKLLLLESLISFPKLWCAGVGVRSTALEHRLNRWISKSLPAQSTKLGTVSPSSDPYICGFPKDWRVPFLERAFGF